MNSRIACGLSFALSFVLLGCGGSGVTTVPVQGKVTYKGAPLEGATVAFINKDQGGRTASGQTDAEGNYTLKTYVGPDDQPEGAPAGEYTVTVIKVDSAATAMSPEEMAKKMGAGGRPGATPMMTPPKSAIPEIYNNPTTSGLTASVSSSKTEFNFDLVDK